MAVLMALFDGICVLTFGRNFPLLVLWREDVGFNFPFPLKNLDLPGRAAQSNIPFSPCMLRNLSKTVLHLFP